MLAGGGGGVEIVLSKNDDVNARFLDVVTALDVDYIIRVGADQIFLDVEMANEIMDQMRMQGKDFFYHSGLASVLPDIVSADCLRRCRDNILREDRYFKALEKDRTVSRYEIIYPCTLLYDFRVSSNMSYRVCKHVIEHNLDIYDLSLQLSKDLRYVGNYLNRTGLWGSWIWGNSYEEFFWDENDRVNPWLGETVTDLVTRNLTKDMRVFEWGMGNSTLFWSQYVGEVVSVEYDREWYERMREMTLNNVKMRYSDLVYDGEYCRKVLEEKEKFDIILIDGRDRVRCARNAVEKLKENGIIIWDDTSRECYQEGYDFLAKRGFKQLKLRSVVYGTPGTETYNTLFYRENNVFGL